MQSWMYSCPSFSSPNIRVLRPHAGVLFQVKVALYEFPWGITEYLHMLSENTIDPFIIHHPYQELYTGNPLQVLPIRFSFV